MSIVVAIAGVSGFSRKLHSYMADVWPDVKPVSGSLVPFSPKTKAEWSLWTFPSEQRLLDVYGDVHIGRHVSRFVCCIDVDDDVVDDDDDVEPGQQQLQRRQVLHAGDWSAAFAACAHRLRGRRVRAHFLPKRDEVVAMDHLQSHAEEAGCQWDPTEYQVIFSVVTDWANDRVWLGVCDNAALFWSKSRCVESRLRDTGAVSSAYYKVMESHARFHLPIASTWHVLDVGAAPGGWTQYLNRELSCRVCAVDKGAMAYRSPTVTHVRGLVQESTDLIREAGGGGCFDLVMSDMNVSIEEIAAMMADVFLPFCRPGGYLLLTAKLKRRHVSQRHLVNREPLVRTVDHMLAAYPLEFIGERFLFANRNERTLLFRKQPL